MFKMDASEKYLSNFVKITLRSAVKTIDDLEIQCPLEW